MSKIDNLIQEAQSIIGETKDITKSVKVFDDIMCNYTKEELAELVLEFDDCICNVLKIIESM